MDELGSEIIMISESQIVKDKNNPIGNSGTHISFLRFYWKGRTTTEMFS